MNLSILLVLTISTLNYGSQTSLPRVSYIKAIDVWFQGRSTTWQLHKSKVTGSNSPLRIGSYAYLSFEICCLHLKYNTNIVNVVKLLNVFSGCLVFVCLSLLEAAFVSYVSKWSEQTDRRAGSFSYPSWNNNDKIMDVELNKPLNKCGPKIRTERIHKVSRVIFPILFVFFNLGYFLYYFCM